MLLFLLLTDGAEELKQSEYGGRKQFSINKKETCVTASIYFGWINTAVAMISGVLMCICMSHLHGWETKCWNVGKLLLKRVTVTQIRVLDELRTCIQDAGSGLIIKSFSVPKSEVPRNTWDVWSQLQSTPLRSSNPPLATFVSMAKAVLFTLSFTILHWSGEMWLDGWTGRLKDEQAPRKISQ